MTKLQILLSLLLVTCVFPFTAHAQVNRFKSPNVSANALFWYKNSNLQTDYKSVNRNGPDLREAEVALYSDVDPYSKLVVLLTVHPEYQVDSTTHRVTESWEVEPEELYGESLAIPNLTLRAGKFKADFGKHNELHTHVYPFIDAPLANEMLLGEEGLNDVGVSAAYFLPFDWYSEFTVQYLRGEGENTEFSSQDTGDGVGVGHFKNLWDMSDSATLETGISYALGKNSLGGRTTLSGVDLTYKWRPVVGGKYKSAILAGEVINRDVQQPGVKDEHGLGWNVWGKYQFAERWAALARYDRVDVYNSDADINPNALTNQETQKVAAALNFEASEFSSFKLEMDYSQPTINQVERKIYLQANFTIGAHPAHSY